MLDKFKNFNGERIDNLAAYVRDHVRGINEKRIFVGSDSQVYRDHTMYAVAVCMYNVGNGAHVVYAREKVFEQTLDLHTRLWKEVERTVEVADHLRNGVSDVEIDTHFDVNPDDQFASHIVYQAAIGYAKGAGFNFNVKPNSFAATCAADRLC